MWSSLMFMLLASFAMAQTGTISGTVLDDESGEPLVGANAVLKGTTTGTITDVDGTFTIENVQEGNQTVVFSFVGYSSKELTVKVVGGSTKNVGSVRLAGDAVGLDEIQVVASVAIDRKTPVAVSTIQSNFITEKASSQEFPQLLKTTPGVYATNQGGGFGDARVNIRGFESDNVAVMINGIPVNDMENGTVYWSNWAGLIDVTRTMQVQRGLGASKVAVPSVGGTINVITKTTDAEKGGNIFYGIGNDNRQKVSFGLSTGLDDNGWAFSLSASKTSADAVAGVEGTQFTAYNYFFNLSKQINSKHTLSLTGFGAPQRHGQRQTALGIQTYRNAPQGIKYNPDWGILDGEVVNAEDNFYHKPQFSLNHYWDINETSQLNTVLYASVGVGGGGGRSLNSTPRKPGLSNGYGPIDLDAVAEENAAQPDGNAISYLYASMNTHKWYGLLSTYQKELASNFNILGGIDLRYYRGFHFRKITNLLGADYYLDDNDVNNTEKIVKVGDKFSYNDDGEVLWEGAYVQGEYSNDALSGFVSLSLSNTSYRRYDFFNYLDSDPKQVTDWQNFVGYQVKGGLNYNLNAYHNLFANVGYFQKAPYFDAVFLNNLNDINQNAVNQKIISYEIGYGYRSANFDANINLYNTQWRDRSFTQTFQVDDDPNTPVDESQNLYYANILGVNALHQGVEIDFKYQPAVSFTVRGMASFGNWRWMDNVDGVAIFDEEQNKIGEISTLYIKDLKVGGAAQNTFSLSADYQILKSLKAGVVYNFYGDNYADFDPTSRDDESAINRQAFKLPDYQLVDFNIVFDFKLGDFDASLYGNVNNLLDVEYLSDAYDADAIQNVTVFYGLGRTWTTGLRIKF